MGLEEQILDSWNIHNRINLYLLDAISPAALIGVSASKGRNVGEQFQLVSSWLRKLTSRCTWLSMQPSIFNFTTSISLTSHRETPVNCTTTTPSMQSLRIACMHSLSLAALLLWGGKTWFWLLLPMLRSA